MPNWCNNDVRVFGNKEELKRFLNDVKEARRLSEESGHWFTYEWFITTGVCERPEDDAQKEIPQEFYNKDYIRGNVIQIEDCEDFIILNFETAWSDMRYGLDNIFSKYNGIEYVLLAVEEGESVFVNTDKEGKFFKYKYRFYLELDDGDFCEEEYVETEEEALKIINELNLRKTPFKTIEQITNYCEKHDGCFYWDEFSD